MTTYGYGKNKGKREVYTKEETDNKVAKKLYKHITGTVHKPISALSWQDCLDNGVTVNLGKGVYKIAIYATIASAEVSDTDIDVATIRFTINGTEYSGAARSSAPYKGSLSVSLQAEYYYEKEDENSIVIMPQIYCSRAITCTMAAVFVEEIINTTSVTV